MFKRFALTVVLFSTFLGSPAFAGIWDWFSSNDEESCSESLNSVDATSPSTFARDPLKKGKNLEINKLVVGSGETGLIVDGRSVRLGVRKGGKVKVEFFSGADLVTVQGVVEAFTQETWVIRTDAGRVIFRLAEHRIENIELGQVGKY